MKGTMIPSKLYLPILVMLILLGMLVYFVARSIPIRRTLLLVRPYPVPSEIVSVKPAPGSHIAVSVFNRQGNEVCFEVYDSPLGLDLADKSSSFDRLTLLLNGKPASGYGVREGPWSSSGISIYQSREMKGLLSQVCWAEVILSPGDYLAELSIKGVNSTLVYEWAFRITGE